MRRNLFGHRLLLGALVAGLLVPAGAATAAPERSDVVVLAPGHGAAADLVARHGGVVGSELPYLGAVTASLGAAEIAALDARPDVTVVEDHPLEITGTDLEPGDPRFDGDNAQLAALRLPEHWNRAAGVGVGVALLDTGVAADADVPELAGRIVRGPDLSDDDDAIDHHGHGTFMAGLIAGDGTSSTVDAARFGVAPGAHVVSVKLAGRDGLTSLARVLEGIGWVIEHRDDHGIRVLNISLGVASKRAPQADPLSAAVQAAWAAGITVVTAAGNEGAGTVTSPGRDPWVITVGATDGAPSPSVADWSGSGKVAGVDRPDLLAPGESTISLRAPGSAVDEEHGASSRVDDRYMRGSGTSMSAALVSGAAAVLAEHRPAATPDDIKGALVSSGDPVAGERGVVVDLAAADAAEADASWRQSHPIHPHAFRTVGEPAMPWDRPDAPSSADSWQRLRWMDGAWHRLRWMDGEWQRLRWMDENWQRLRWMEDGWQRLRWMEDDWQRLRWMDGEWQRLRWMDENWQRLRWMEADWQRLRWMDDAWSRARWMEANWQRARWMDAHWQRARWMDLDWARARWMAADWSAEPALTAPASWGDPAAASVTGAPTTRSGTVSGSPPSDRGRGR